MPRSIYDELHDRFYSILSTKAGTRYERLAAVVFKRLDESGTVIHNVKLVGDSDVAHQLDVTIERNGKKSRALIECKDFDISGESVGLGVVRNFFAVVEDTKPDDAFIVTCNDFTSDARQYAKAKGIKLVLLRTVTAADLEGHIRTVVLNLTIATTTTPRVSFGVATEADRTKFMNDLQAAGIEGSGIYQGAPVHIVGPHGEQQINEFTEGKAVLRSSPGPKSIDVDVTDLYLEVQNRGPIKLSKLNIAYEVRHTKTTSEIGGDKIALLLLQGAGDADLIVCDADLKRYTIDASGEISPTDVRRPT